MDLRPSNKLVSRARESRAVQTSPFARTLLLAVLVSHISTVTAAPISSLHGSAPGFDAGPAVATAGGALDHARIHTTSLDALSSPSVHSGSEEDNDWTLEYEDLADEDENLMPSMDGAGTTIAQAVKDSTTSSPPPNTAPTMNHLIGPLTLPESLVASFTRILQLGFWRGLLGSFFVFWALVASTVGALVVVGLRVRRMDQSGRLSRMRVAMELEGLSREWKEWERLEEGRRGRVRER